MNRRIACLASTLALAIAACTSTPTSTSSQAPAAPATATGEYYGTLEPVSYTHLTLPTICSV